MSANAQGIKAGRAYVELGANDVPLKASMKAAEASLKSWGQGIATVGAGMAAMGAAITAPLLLAAKTFADAGASLLNMSARTGASVEALSQLGFAASQTGTDLDTVEISIKKMQKSIVAAAQGSEEAQQAFAMLGLPLVALARLKPEESFRAIAKSLATIPNPTQRAALALQIFGRGGTAILPLAKNFDALTKEARDFGLVVSTESAESAQAFAQSMDLLNKVLGTIVKTVGSALAPTWIEWNRSMARIGKSVKDLIAANKPFVTMLYSVGLGLTIAGAALIGLGIAFSVVGSVLGGITAAFGALAAVIGFIASPLGLVVAAMAVWAFAILKYTDLGQKALAYLGEKFSGFKDVAVQAFGGIADALKAGDIELAGKILWAGLQALWKQGTAVLKEEWAKVSTFAVDKWESMKFELARILTDVWANMEAGALEAIANITKAFDAFVDSMSKKWAPLGAGIRTALVGAGAALPFAGQAAVAGTGPAGIAEGVGADQAQAVRDKANQANALLTAQQAAEKAARGGGDDAARVAAQVELDKALDELSDLRTKASRKAAEVSGGVKTEPGKGEENFTPEGLDKALEDAQKKVEVRGSFSAAALSGIGVSDTASEQLKEQKKSNEKLEKIDKSVRETKQVFGT